MRLLLALPLLLAMACGDEFSNAPLEDDGKFLAAAPSGAQLRLSVGAADGALRQALVAEPAEFYLFTRQTVLGLNAVGFNLLRDVDRLVAAPPTERADDLRVWSTPASGLERFDARFEMRRADAGAAFDYHLEQDAVETIRGRFDPKLGTGALTFDLDAVAALGGAPVQGQIIVDYALDGAAVDLAIGFRGLVTEAGDRRDTNYGFSRDADGAGTFDFEFQTDEGANVHVRSRWLADGAGRADATVMGADSQAVITECWGTDFAQVFYRSGDATVGAVGDCAFADVSLPEDVEIAE